MATIFPADEPPAAHNKSARGRPMHAASPEHVRKMQRLLSHWHRTQNPSWVTGRPLTDRASAYLLWHLVDDRSEQLGFAYDYGVWTPPPLAKQSELRQLREAAINTVRAHLVRRAKAHLRAAIGGGEVLGVVLRNAVGGSTYGIPAAGNRAGLPGLYSPEWPTPIGGPGEASLAVVEQVLDAVELVRMTPDQIRAQIARHAPPDSTPALFDGASVAEAVASNFSRTRDRSARNAERRIERIVAETRKWEYQLVGNERLTGRQPLPAASYAAVATRRP